MIELPARDDLGDGVVPRDRLEATAALRSDAPERREHAQGRVDALGVGAHLAADHPLREGMRGVARDLGQPSVCTFTRRLHAEGQSCGQTERMAASTVSCRPVLAALARLNPFTTPEARRLGLLFGVVYFAQGMWYLPNQALTILLKDRGLSAGQVADFFLLATIPWLIKPAYGLLSDFVPLFGWRRKSYFLLATALASGAGFALAADCASIPTGRPRSCFTLMGLGLAFTDVLTDALMVEKGRPLGLTGAFQAVQWAAIYTASHPRRRRRRLPGRSPTPRPRLRAAPARFPSSR